MSNGTTWIIWGGWVCVWKHGFSFYIGTRKGILCQLWLQRWREWRGRLLGMVTLTFCSAFLSSQKALLQSFLSQMTAVTPDFQEVPCVNSCRGKEVRDRSLCPPTAPFLFPSLRGFLTAFIISKPLALVFFQRIQSKLIRLGWSFKIINVSLGTYQKNLIHACVTNMGSSSFTRKRSMFLFPTKAFFVCSQG